MLSHLSKYFLDYLQYKTSRLVSGRKDYEQWKSKNYSLRTAVIKNKKLAQELEIACQENNGFLTYEEFLDIDQFGQYGYHATHKMFGKTPTHSTWGKAIATLCKQKRLTHVVEFGPGDGSLGTEIAKESKKMHHPVLWTGIEINSNLRSVIKKRFQKEHLTNYLRTIIPSVDDLGIQEKCLVVSSYSLDSIPPQIYINTKEKIDSPNALIGIKVENGILEEIVLDATLLEKNSLSLQKGKYTNTSGRQWDISSWKLHQGQRAYIPIKAFTLVADIITKISPESQLLIIDEFRSPPRPWETQHLCLPKNLHLYKRDCDNLEKCYKEAGENLLYYPTYLQTFLHALSGMGFEEVDNDIEQRFAKKIIGEPWKEKGGYYCTYALLTSGKVANPKTFLPLLLPTETAS